MRSLKSITKRIWNERTQNRKSRKTPTTLKQSEEAKEHKETTATLIETSSFIQETSENKLNEKLSLEEPVATRSEHSENSSPDETEASPNDHNFSTTNATSMKTIATHLFKEVVDVFDPETSIIKPATMKILELSTDFVQPQPKSQPNL